MRELFAHSVRSLTGVPLCLVLLLIVIGPSAFSLPRPIGNLSDYGNVLDRHGRDKINSLIQAAKSRYGIDVYILASWDDSFNDLDRYAVEVLNYWGIATGNTLLAVFVRTGQDWGVRVVAGTQLATSHPGLARTVRAAVSDLVAHRRIREAMEGIFPALSRALEGAGPAGRESSGGGAGRILLAALVIALLGVAAFFAHRRICPRCGHLLRVRRVRRLYGEDVVYYCPHCHYTRIKRERARGPRR